MDTDLFKNHLTSAAVTTHLNKILFSYPNHYLQSYKILDAVWRHFGYEIHPELFIDLEWQDFGDKEPSKKKMVCWVNQFRKIIIECEFFSLPEVKMSGEHLN